MDELENTQSEAAPEAPETPEAVESTEGAEERTLEEAAHEPGARVEETQDYEQAEAVESVLTEAVEPSDESSPEEPQEAVGTPEVWDDRAEEGGATFGANPGVPEGDSGWLGTSDDDRILAEPTPADVVEVPESVQVKSAVESDGTVDRDDHPVEEEPELSTSPGEPEEGEYYVDARGVIHSEGEDQEGGIIDGGIDDNVAGHKDPGDPPPPPEVEGRAGIAQSPEPGGTPPTPDDAIGNAIEVPDEPGGGGPGPDLVTVAEDPEPGTDPSPPNFELDGVIPGDAQDLSPGFDGNVADDARGLSPGVDGNVAQSPEPGPHPFPYPAENPSPGGDPPPSTDDLGLGMEEAALRGEDGEMLVSLEERMLVTEDGEFLVVGIEEAGLGEDGMAGEMESEGDAEGDPDAPAEGEDGDEGAGEAQNWYVKEDSEGNVSVVDEDGNPVESPPKIVYFQGKYYAVYPGDDLPVKEDGTVSDPNKLSKYEISSYKPSTEGMKIYSDEDGNPVVVDEDGNPVTSPPAVVQDPSTGKYYFVTETDPSKLSSFAKSGNFADALSQGLIKEATDYKPPTEGMKIYSDESGNPVVVDENGHPVASPPAVVQDPTTGKYYFVTEADPSKLSSFAKSGNFADALSQGLIKEAPDYKPTTDGMHIYPDDDGNPVVVDGNGHPVESPPSVVQDPTTGKYYFVTETDPSKLSSFAKSGNFADALSQGLIKEAPNYKPAWWKKKIS